MQVDLTPASTQISFTTFAMGLFPLGGHFTRFHGELQYDPADADACSVALDIDVASLSMADPARVRTALGPRLLNAAAFPNMTYHGTCSGGLATGLLTMHGATRPVSLSLVNDGAKMLARGDLHRQDFGLTGLPGLVGRTIRIAFAVTLPVRLAKPASP